MTKPKKKKKVGMLIKGWAEPALDGTWTAYVRLEIPGYEDPRKADKRAEQSARSLGRLIKVLLKEKYKARRRSGKRRNG